MQCIGWESTYQEDREFGGHYVRQNVTEFLFATAHGLVHYKVCETKSGKTRVFTDLDTAFKITSVAPSENERLKKHKQFVWMSKKAPKQGSRVSYIPFGNTDDALKNRPVLHNAINSDERAMNAWCSILGVSDMPTFDEIVTKAEEITAEKREADLREKALEMVGVDEMWGMF